MVYYVEWTVILKGTHSMLSYFSLQDLTIMLNILQIEKTMKIIYIPQYLSTRRKSEVGENHIQILSDYNIRFTHIKSSYYLQ